MQLHIIWLIYQQMITVILNLAGKSPVYGIIFKQLGQGMGVGQVIDSNDLHVRIFN